MILELDEERAIGEAHQPYQIVHLDDHHICGMRRPGEHLPQVLRVGRSHPSRTTLPRPDAAASRIARTPCIRPPGSPAPRRKLPVGHPPIGTAESLEQLGHFRRG